jgi:hypothetical protein
MDILEVIWQCYDVGIYTIEIAQELVHHPEIHDILPFADATLEDLCADVYEELG